MIKNVIGSIRAASHRLVSNWRASLLFLLLDVAMLLTIYLFLTTAEATIGQVAVLGVTVVIAPLIFFVIQTMGVSYMIDQPEAGKSGAGRLLSESLKGFWKLVVVSIPFVLLTWLLIYLVGKIPGGTAVAHDAVRTAATPGHVVTRTAVTQPTDWRGVAVSAVQFLLFGIVLPIAAINLWIAAARQGLRKALRAAHHTLYKSFAPGSLLIYLVGLVVFGVVPYLLVGMRPPIKGEWIEVGQLVVQLALAGLLSLFGWVLTLGALTQRQISESASAPR